MLLLSCGQSTVRFMPPLMITQADVDEAITIRDREPGGSAEQDDARNRHRQTGRALPRNSSAAAMHTGHVRRASWRACLAAGAITTAVDVAHAAREPVLKQIGLPHYYYYREMFLPQLTGGPSSVDFSPDGRSLVYSMAGSLWRQAIDGDIAVELTHGPGYDYQPDWSPDGRYIAFVRHDRNASRVVAARPDDAPGSPADRRARVNLQPRYSPEGRRLAYVSTTGSGHFNLFVAPIDGDRLGTPRALVAPQRKRDRTLLLLDARSCDQPIVDAGRQARRVRIESRSRLRQRESLQCEVEAGGNGSCFVHEETSWRANPEVAPDGRRVLYSSYQGRQWHQLWLDDIEQVRRACR